VTEDIEALLRSGPGGEAALAAEAARRFSERAAAEGLADVSYTVVDSPVGDLLLAGTGRGLVRLAYLDRDGGEELVLGRLAGSVSPRIVRAPGALDQVRRELDEYFEGRRRTFDVPQDWRLMSAFAKRVLKATYAIPYGQVSDYGAIAAEAGSPRGARAAGNALGANPLPIVVPCHRVLRHGGVLGGYGGGPERKRTLLALEGSLP
jgi:methylated-DNA-[protein]-cysteine S-methyltransferase